MTGWKGRGWRDQYVYGTRLSPGFRVSYRVGSISPSPSYTSDSEDTLRHKRRYRSHSVWVGRRWYARVLLAQRRRARYWRTLACWVVANKGGDSSVAQRVVSFLPSVKDARGRFLPEYNRLGILVSPHDRLPTPRLGLVDPWTADMLVDDRNLNGRF